MINTLHPCFDETLSGCRIHLPIAKRCNTKCNYCRIGISSDAQRPGVTESILDVNDVVTYVNKSLEIYDDCKIIGIAGPGDPLANPDETFEAFKRINKNFPDFKKCMCTNGFGVKEHIKKIEEAGIDYITLTINSVCTDSINNIYKFIYYRDKYYEGIEAGKLILDLQKTALELLSSIENLKIKINVVLIPGVNDKELDNLMLFLNNYRIDIINVIPLLPVNDTKFKNIEAFTHGEFCEIKEKLHNKFPNIKFKGSCQRCRSDARGNVRSC
ncbi:FeMo cofactor biosynthesis protein NifB [Ruminiclostridium hungatei]|uniref:FeMo cofactor biosynthesis protein NifB n=1 Tax=Ruminiclostridium hungatei TaxID=48256 RepID=A0A1V4SK96_RUMHU|nr:radical SAM protein [Ruminiclostridium hungatei]OPX43916.1 FeMo cofactor biosynthesis protein NifB [Ruminiclostridium hungatei]